MSHDGSFAGRRRRGSASRRGAQDASACKTILQPSAITVLTIPQPLARGVKQMTPEAGEPGMKQLPVPATDRWGNRAMTSQREIVSYAVAHLMGFILSSLLSAFVLVPIYVSTEIARSGGEPLHLGLRDVRDRADDRLCACSWHFAAARSVRHDPGPGANRQERQACGTTSIPPLVVGEGRISGYLSIAFGGLSVLGVLCFLFPDALTTPSLRPATTSAGCGFCWAPGWCSRRRSAC